MAKYLDAANEGLQAEWQEGALFLDPRANTTRVRTQARALGRLHGDDGQRRTVYSSSGPLPTPLWDRETRSFAERLTHDPHVPGTGVRAVQPVEYARLKGMAHLKRERSEERVVRSVLAAAPPRAAE